MEMTVKVIEEYGLGPKIYQIDYEKDITIRPVVKIEQLVPTFPNGVWREDA